jgi:hypothetical protein
VFHDRKQWVKVTGRIIQVQILPGRSAPHPKLFVVELLPEDSTPVQAEIRVRPGHQEHGYGDLYFRMDKEVTGFLLNPATREVRFDMTDPRNSRSAHAAARASWAASPDYGQPTPADSGPPWLVLPTCPSCRKPVDQRRAAMGNEPRCPLCVQPLPASPLVTRTDRQ